MTFKRFKRDLLLTGKITIVDFYNTILGEYIYYNNHLLDDVDDTIWDEYEVDYYAINNYDQSFIVKIKYTDPSNEID